MASPAVLYQTGDHASRPANGSGCVLYSCTTHDLVYRDDGTAWTTFMTLVGGSGGDIATDAIWDAKGDLAVGTGATTAARLAVGANGSRPIAASGEATGIKWEGAAWADFVPTMTGPTIGSSTLIGRAKQVDANTWLLYMSLSVVTGGAWSAGAAWNFTNFPAVPLTGKIHTLHGFIHDTGTGLYAISARIGGGTGATSHIICADAAGSRIVSGTVPITPATGDEYMLAGFIEV